VAHNNSSAMTVEIKPNTPKDEIDRLLQSMLSKRETNANRGALKEFFGKLKNGQDGLKFQQESREE
jgi:hypothetical protein